MLESLGLSEEEAARRLAADGPNELPSAKKRGPLWIALEVVREPMFPLLVACGVLYLILGDVREALLLLGFVFVVAGITFVQERKTERALDALRDLSSPRALVVRSGQKRRIAGREVVRGDALLLSEGDRIPADAVVVDCTSLSVDESLLTGESVPVPKVATAERGRHGPPRRRRHALRLLRHVGRAGAGIAVVRATGRARRWAASGRRWRCWRSNAPRCSARPDGSSGCSPASAYRCARWSC